MRGKTKQSSQLTQKKHLTKFNKLPFMIKTHNNLGIEGNYLNKMKAICEKPTANITFSGEGQKLFL